jgi:hypothetical protein
MTYRIEAQRPSRNTQKSNDVDAGFGQLDHFRRKKHAVEKDQQVGHDLPLASHLGVEEIHRQAAEAWVRLERGQTFADWLAVGASLEAERAEAMREAHVNQPRGKGYCVAFGRLVARRPFAKLEQTTRARLLEVMEHRAEIESWLATLPLSKRLQLNHPHSVLRAWNAASNVADSNDPRPPSPVAKLKESIASQEEEIYRLRREVERGGGDLWTSKDRPTDIAKVMVAKLSRRKAEAVARAMLEMRSEATS